MDRQLSKLIIETLSGRNKLISENQEGRVTSGNLSSPLAVSLSKDSDGNHMIHIKTSNQSNPLDGHGKTTLHMAPDGTPIDQLDGYNGFSYSGGHPTHLGVVVPGIRSSFGGSETHNILIHDDGQVSHYHFSDRTGQDFCSTPGNCDHNEVKNFLSNFRPTITHAQERARVEAYKARHTAR